MLLNQGNPNWKKITHIRNIRREELTHALAQVHSHFLMMLKAQEISIKEQKSCGATTSCLTD